MAHMCPTYRTIILHYNMYKQMYSSKCIHIIIHIIGIKMHRVNIAISMVKEMKRKESTVATTMTIQQLTLLFTCTLPYLWLSFAVYVSMFYCRDGYTRRRKVHHLRVNLETYTLDQLIWTVCTHHSFNIISIHIDHHTNSSSKFHRRISNCNHPMS